MKKWIYLTVVLLFSFCCSVQSIANATLEYRGYSNLAAGSDGSHFNGYGLDLFREGNILFGSFEVASDSEDINGAPLENIKLDLNNHQLAFRVRMSLGREYGPGIPVEGRPSRDLIEFNGKITESKVFGTLLLKDGYNPDAPGKSKFIVLKRMYNTGVNIRSYSQWLSYPWNHPLPDTWQPQ